MARIILKISGEALKGYEELVSTSKLKIIQEIIEILQKENHLLGIVIGGGNIFRGREHPEMNKLTGDSIGMLGTVINALYLANHLEKVNIPRIVSTPFDFPYLLENFSDTELISHYENKEVVIFGGGVGMSGYSTDSGCVLAAHKLQSDLIIKLTNVDGIYTDDPKVNKDAQKLDNLTFQEVIANGYQVMDEYAFQECAKTDTKIIVMNLDDYKKINDVINGKVNLGTRVG